MDNKQLLALMAAILYDREIAQEYGRPRAINEAISKAKQLIESVDKG